jgi:2-desacetyl-2-hydroxyethyl bacteriochlorophyllide A dehydrogenase
MQALVFHGLRQLSVEAVPEPVLKPGEVLVQVAVCGICGSDLHGYLGHSARRNASIPLIMGHEFTGQIAALGPDFSGDLAVGQRVVVQPQISCGRCRACRSGLANICPNMSILGIERAGAFAERVAVPAQRVFPLPDGLSDTHGALIETLAVEVHLFRQMARPLLRTVVVLGAGAQGLLAAQLARLGGASQIIVTDLMPHRLRLAEQMGATAVLRADEDVVAGILRLTDGWGAEFVIDAVGASTTRQQGVAVLAPGGTFGLVGLGPGETTLNFVPVINRELVLHGSYCYSDDDFLRALELLAAGHIQVGSMLELEPLREGAALFERLMDPAAGLTKVLLQTS